MEGEESVQEHTVDESGMAVFPVGGAHRTQGFTLTRQVLCHGSTPPLSGNESCGVSDVSVGTSETARNHFVCFWAMSTE